MVNCVKCMDDSMSERRTDLKSTVCTHKRCIQIDLKHMGVILISMGWLDCLHTTYIRERLSGLTIQWLVHDACLPGMKLRHMRNPHHRVSGVTVVANVITYISRMCMRDCMCRLSTHHRYNCLLSIFLGWINPSRSRGGGDKSMGGEKTRSWSREYTWSCLEPTWPVPVGAGLGEL